MENTSVRKIRLAVGVSQQRFAEIIGLSYDAVQSIETGRLAVSWSTAERIAAKTGALAIDLMSGDPVVETPRAWHGKAYETTDFHAWRAGTGLLENTDLFAACFADFLKAVPIERRAEIQARAAQFIFQPSFETIANNASRAQRAVGKYDLEDLRGFTARVNQ